jgi:predicted site-specific integrase-resolvase
MQLEKLWNLDELCQQLPDKPSKWTVYTWISKGKIPYVKRGKKVFFEPHKIQQWEQNNRPTVLNLTKIISDNDTPIKTIE